MLDVKGGVAVLARGGHRDHYAPVASVLHEGSDPVQIARAYQDVLGLEDVYLADLDAIAGLPPSYAIMRAIADLGMRLWVDAGVRTADEMGPLIQQGASSVIVGLETLAEPAHLNEIVSRFGADRVVFSLDMKNGQPMVPTRESWGTDDPQAIAEIAINGGICRMILLDLARVGMGCGTGTEPLLRALRRDHPSLEITVGGGIAASDDLLALRREGALAVLVGSALHDGRIAKNVLD